MLFILVLPGAVAYASFFSFFSDIFTKVNIEEKTINSQNVALLAAVGGPATEDEIKDPGVNIAGQSALIPDSGPEGGLADVDDGDYDHGQISIYVVREGDSLSSIAKMYKVSANTILWANNLSVGAKIRVGDTLIILPVSGVQHTVKKGDTIASVAKKYKADVEEISSYNGIEENEPLPVGSVILVPDGEIPAPPVSASPQTTRLRNASGPAYDGYYKAPLASYRRSQGLHGYNGVDLVSYDGPGAFVMAAAAGEVIISREGCRSRGCNGGYGNYVVIKHNNGTQTLYAHLKATAVSVGQYVAQGQLVGYEGNTGRSTGTHLHFEIRGARNPF